MRSIANRPLSEVRSISEITKKQRKKMKNRIQLSAIGRLTADATIHPATGGHLIAFTVAANYRQKGEEVTIYIECAYYRSESNGVKIAEYLRKGAMVNVQGMPKAEAFTTKSGEVKAAQKLNVDTVDILVYAGESATSPAVTARIEPNSKGDDFPW